MPLTHAEIQRRYREKHPEYMDRERERVRRYYHASEKYRAQMSDAKRRYLATAKGMLTQARAGAKRRVNAPKG